MPAQNSPAQRGDFVLVIGGGQAGLATGYHLKSRGVRFRILAANDRIGDSWRRRYASLSLFTPRFLSALPGLPLSGEPEGYASRDEFADYLERYAKTFDLPVSLGVRVSKLSRVADGGFEALLSTGETVRASHVIVAAGGFQIPVTPKMAQALDADVRQLSPETIGDFSSVPAGTVLIVGDGASGRDIAVELAASRRVILATGKTRKLFPERILGKSTWWWLKTLGLMGVSGTSLIGRLMRRADPFPDRDRNLNSLKRRGIDVAARLTGLGGRKATFADGRAEEISAVIWATGYRDDTSWLAIEGAVGEGGRYEHRAGVSPIPRLYFVGRPWQRGRASALIAGVGADAQAIVANIDAPDSPLGVTPPRQPGTRQLGNPVFR